MSNLEAKINQTSIEINGELYLSQIWDSEISQNLQTVSNLNMNTYQMKTFYAITFLLFYSL